MVQANELPALRGAVQMSWRSGSGGSRLLGRMRMRDLLAVELDAPKTAVTATCSGSEVRSQHMEVLWHGNVCQVLCLA